VSQAGPEQDDAAEQTGPTVRDRRRIDPETFEVREPQSAAPAPEAADETGAGTTPAPGEGDRVSELETALTERTADLQRLQAEYVNYKRRVDRDRDVSRKGAIEGVLKDLLPVLDDIRSAREHGELTGAFKAVGDEVTRITARHGLDTFGEKGDPFDPHVHEALLHAHAPDVTGPTCVEILQPGYRVGERVLRPARVAVAEPDPDAPAAPEAEPSTSEQPSDAAQD
jgi:molecular chaperone GrpE